MRTHSVESHSGAAEKAEGVRGMVSGLCPGSEESGSRVAGTHESRSRKGRGRGEVGLGREKVEGSHGSRRGNESLRRRPLPELVVVSGLALLLGKLTLI